MSKIYVAQYGASNLPRGQCPNCEDPALIIDGEFACCGKETQKTPEYYKKMSESVGGRHKSPPLAVRRYLLIEQENRCLYCQRIFGSLVVRKGKIKKLKLNWDHLIPYTYAQSNCPENYVAACHICNQIKGNRCFNTMEECRAYINRLWFERRIFDLEDE